ncbi:HEAT repeat domain-containing protein [Polaribacter ponticola]|uniref:HEAT repeat domain-containing protein n=1 Tax=Polaribacter ponticola TaxID=2978475 RepID=A0ABT5S4I4_9FLAO|nr:HEAT repeat domain-containing protein [Polaribacter sp. MSW5]MDD7913015.1 HEAT repeat domain-containing protein [Polaribacter sp. MSW5]
MSFVEWFLSFIYKIKTFPLIIQITIVLTLTFIVVTFSVLITVYVIRRKHNRVQRKLKDSLPKIEDLFNDVLFSDKNYSENEIFNSFEDIVGEINYESIDTGLDVLVDIKNDSIKESEKYPVIISALNLIEHIESKFDSRSNSRKMDAFQQSFVLGLNRFDSKILQYAYSKNKKIRNEARNSYLALSANDPYRFFDEIEGSLTKWDEIELMQYLQQQHKRGNLEGLGKWINYSKNTSLVVFLIKMVGFFKQRGIDEILIDKLVDEDTKVRAASIETLGELNLKNTEQTLIDRYYTEPDLCQVAIVNTIRKFNSGKSLNFLQQIFKDSNSTDMKKIIAEAIINYGYEGKMAFQDLKNVLTGFDLQILKHIETPIIKFK